MSSVGTEMYVSFLLVVTYQGDSSFQGHRGRALKWWDATGSGCLFIVVVFMISCFYVLLIVLDTKRKQKEQEAVGTAPTLCACVYVCACVWERVRECVLVTGLLE